MTWTAVSASTRCNIWVVPDHYPDSGGGVDFNLALHEQHPSWQLCEDDFDAQPLRETDTENP